MMCKLAERIEKKKMNQHLRRTDTYLSKIL